MNVDDDHRIVQSIRVMQIIAAALLAGVAVFLGVVLFLRSQQHHQPPPDLPFLSLVALAMLLVTAPVSFLLPAAVTRKTVRQFATESRAFKNPDRTHLAGLLQLRQTTLLLGLAPLEATAFTALLAMMIEFHVLAMAVAAVAFALMLLQFPTETKVRAWLGRQQAWLEEMSLSSESN